MSNSLIQNAFIAGELSKQLFGRSDLEKYDLGVAEALNFQVDYRGGMSNSPGTQFIDYVKNDGKPTKFIPFEFSPDVANTLVMLFGDKYIRFIQDDGYVLETAITVSGVTQASPGVVTAVGHGFAAKDWVKFDEVVGMTELNGQTYEVRSVPTPDTFELNDVFGKPLDTSGFTAYASGGKVSRIYTVATPYDGNDLELLRAEQILDTIRLTHKSYSVRNLVRSGSTSWALSEENIGNDDPIPQNLVFSYDGGATTDAGVAWTVTAVNYETGEESAPAPVQVQNNIGNHTQQLGQLEYTWDVVVGAEYYNLYRSLVIKDGDWVNAGMDLGWIGKTFGTTFIDPNIIPDFTTAPPVNYDPFADGSIRHIEVTAGGSGYLGSTTMTIADPDGSGFVGVPIVDDETGGKIIGVIVINGGKGYTNPTVSFVGAGAGAIATADVGPLTGNNPSLSARFQQRQWYAGTANKPLGLFASRPGQLSNFDYSRVSAGNDSIELEIDSPEVTPIRHLVVSRGGLLVFTQKTVWQLSGGTGDSREPITPLNALADPQSYTGCSTVVPLNIGQDILYIEGKGITVRLLSYAQAQNSFAGTDVSVLATHLFPPTNLIRRMTWAQDPSKIAYCVREDGTVLQFTIVKEQNVFAWTRRDTKGMFRDVISVQEDAVDSVYYLVERFINGMWTKLIEKQSSRSYANVEDAWFVDSGLSLDHTYPEAQLTPTLASGLGVSFTADDSVFASGDVGKIIRAGGGKARITAFVSSTEVTVDILRDITDVIAQDPDNTPLPAAQGEWTMDAEVTSVGGLGHLEGQMLTGLADGNVVRDLVVAGGSVTLPFPASSVILGLGYIAYIRTLPPTVEGAIIEGKRQRHVGVALHVTESRGVEVGTSLDRMYPMKDRTIEVAGEPTALQDKTEYLLVEDFFEEDKQTYFRQANPLPATILSAVFDTEVGDDND